MEKFSNKQKINSEAQKQTDPLQSVMMEHLLQELMFQHFTGIEVKKFMEVSPFWSEIVSGSKKCGSLLKLIIRTNDNAEKLNIIKASGKKYGALKVGSRVKKEIKNCPLLLEVSASIALNLKELKFFCSMDIKVTAKLLSSLNNIESLTFEKCYSFGNVMEKVNNLPPVKLPMLKELRITNCPSNSSEKLLLLLKKISTLETFQFGLDNSTNFRILEYSILRQDKLTTLDLGSNHNQLFADKNLLNKMKFKLDSICIGSYTIHPNSAVEFFKRQQSLSKVELHHAPEDLLSNPPELCDALRSIFTLPKMETLKIVGKMLNFDFQDLSSSLETIINTSVKFLEFEFDLTEALIHGKLVEMFPNLKQISVKTKNESTNLRYIDVSIDKLSLIKCEDLEGFVYRPLIDFDPNTFEAKLEEFLLKHPDIENLYIGRDEWIFMNIKLSLSFWVKLLQKKPKLDLLMINHPGNLANLAKLLSDTAVKFLIIYTDGIGKESVETITTREKKSKVLIVRLI